MSAKHSSGFSICYTGCNNSTKEYHGHMSRENYILLYFAPLPTCSSRSIVNRTTTSRHLGPVATIENMPVARIELARL